MPVGGRLIAGSTRRGPGALNSGQTHLPLTVHRRHWPGPPHLSLPPSTWHGSPGHGGAGGAGAPDDWTWRAGPPIEGPQQVSHGRFVDGPAIFQARLCSSGKCPFEQLTVLAREELAHGLHNRRSDHLPATPSRHPGLVCTPSSMCSTVRRCRGRSSFVRVPFLFVTRVAVFGRRIWTLRGRGVVNARVCGRSEMNPCGATIRSSA